MARVEFVRFSYYSASCCHEPWNPPLRNIRQLRRHPLPPSDPAPTGPAPTAPIRLAQQARRLATWFTHWSIEQRVLAGFGLVFLGILVISVMSYRNTAVVVKNSRLDTES